MTQEAITIGASAETAVTIPYSRIIEVAPDEDTVRVVYRADEGIRSLIIGPRSLADQPGGKAEDPAI